MIPKYAKKPGRAEPMDARAAVLPALAQKLLRQKKKKSYHGLYDYVQINLTYSSCRMASNRLTRQQVETIFRKGKVSVSFEPMKVSDLVEVLNHCVCMDYILDHAQEPLTSKFIKLVPDLVVPMSEHRTFKYFKEESLQKYADQYGWTLIDDTNRKDLFLDMIRQSNCMI